jgi:hypothetical protein
VCLLVIISEFLDLDIHMHINKCQVIHGMSGFVGLQLSAKSGQEAKKTVHCWLSSMTIVKKFVQGW